MKLALSLLLAAHWTLLGTLGAAETTVSKEQPHVLLILVDDLGWMDLHCQGNARLNTPRIDALAKQGVRFTSAYSASPVCSPTRAALITGLAPARLHITQHGKDGANFWPDKRTIQPPTAEHVLPLSSLTVAERLKQVGYTTGFFGKWHLSGELDAKKPNSSGPEFWPEHQGFDINIGGCGFGGPPTYFDPYRIPSIKPRNAGEYLTDRLADEAAAFIQTNHTTPMFICLWTYNVHYPFEAPAELVANYKGKEGKGLKNPVYGAQVEATDRAVGRVLDEIDRLGIADNTLVIFTSDNGGWDGATDNRPLRSGKGDLYEGGLRVPLLIRWPSLENASAQGSVSDTPVITMDLAATVLDAAHAEISADNTFDGVTLRPLLQGKALQRDSLCFHYPHFAWHKANRPGSAIRSGQYKLIRRYDDDSIELFDLSNDLSETQNLALQLPAVATRLNAELQNWLSATAAQLPSQVEQ